MRIVRGSNRLKQYVCRERERERETKKEECQN